jgi:hypothetical protein
VHCVTAIVCSSPAAKVDVEATAVVDAAMAQRQPRAKVARATAAHVQTGVRRQGHRASALLAIARAGVRAETDQAVASAAMARAATATAADDDLEATVPSVRRAVSDQATAVHHNRARLT